jgi:hypothetical protein
LERQSLDGFEEGLSRLTQARSWISRLARSRPSIWVTSCRRICSKVIGAINRFFLCSLEYMQVSGRTRLLHLPEAPDPLQARESTQALRLTFHGLLFAAA